MPDVTLLDLVVALDMHLTQKPVPDCDHTARGQGWAGDPDKWAFGGSSDGIYYCSDGGYSRLYVPSLSDPPVLQLITTASPEHNAKLAERWANPIGRAIRTAIEATIRAYLKKVEGLHE